MSFELKKSGLSLNPTGLSLKPSGLTTQSQAATPPHPFDAIEYTDNDEIDAKAEFNEVQRAFMERNKAEQDRFKLATDSEYWCCLVFQSREQKEQFLASVKWLVHGDKYIDGVRAARTLGIDLMDVQVPYNTSEGKTVSKNLRDMTDD